MFKLASKTFLRKISLKIIELKFVIDFKTIEKFQ